MAVGSNVVLSLSNVTSASVEVRYSIVSGGDESGEIVVFDSNNTEVMRTATFNIIGGTSGSESIVGLPNGARYTAKFYSETEESYSASTVSFTVPMTNKIYGGKNDKARAINIFYGGVAIRSLDSVTGVIREGGAGIVTGFDPITFVNAVEGKIDNSKTLKYIQTVKYESTYPTHPNTFILIVVYTNNSLITLETYASRETISDYGITTKITNDGGADQIDLTPVYSTTYEARKIAKLYGSVNGETKLIHQGFGHLSYT